MPPEPSQDVARPEGGVPGFRVKCEAEVVGPQEFYQQSYVPDPIEQERRPSERPQGLGSVTRLLKDYGGAAVILTSPSSTSVELTKYPPGLVE